MSDNGTTYKARCALARDAAQVTGCMIYVICNAAGRHERMVASEPREKWKTWRRGMTIKFVAFPRRQRS